MDMDTLKPDCKEHSSKKKTTNFKTFQEEDYFNDYGYMKSGVH